MLNGPSEHPDQLTLEKQKPLQFGAPNDWVKNWKTPAQILEYLFERHGRTVAKYPWIYIFVVLITTFICSLGIVSFRWENNIVRLWNPKNSETLRNFDWLWKNHPPDLRRHHIIFQAENVLDPAMFKDAFRVRQSLYDTITDENVTWNQACLKVPLVPTEYSDFLTVDEDPEDEKATEDPFAAFGNDDDNCEKINFTEFFSIFVIAFEYKSFFFKSKIISLENIFFREIDLYLTQKDYEDVGKKDFSVEYYPEPYCAIFNSLDDVCFEDSIFELFGKHGIVDVDFIESLSVENILFIINGPQKSGIFSVKKKFINLLGGITYDPEGKIIGAKSMKMNLYGKMNVTEAHLEKIGQNQPLGDQIALEQIDDKTKSIENKFIDILEHEKEENNLTHIDFIIAKSFSDAVNERITGDLPKVFGSFIFMLIYVGLALGKLNSRENKFWLSLSGLFAVVMAMFTSYGICSYFGYFISPLHNFIPFLLLGLGVDDMFVIVQAMDQLGPGSNTREEIGPRLAKTMKNSGVAITVTSLTDFLAFAVGGTTTVPALESFCIFCGLGIVAVYLYQITWFAAWLVIDQRRMVSNRNAYLPCLKNVDPENVEDNDLTKPRFFSKWCLEFHPITKYAEMLTLKPVKIFVMIFTLGLLGLSIIGNYYITEEFDPWLFLDPNSYVSQFKNAHDGFYPDEGQSVLLFFSGNISVNNLNAVDQLIKSISKEENNDFSIKYFDSWYVPYEKYFVNQLEHSDGLLFDEKDGDDNITDDDVKSALVQFLFSPSGGKYQYLFTFDHELQCGKELPQVQVWFMEIKHTSFNSSKDGIKAMNAVKNLLRNSNFQGRVFPFSHIYSVWEIDEIIRGELYRNVGLATFAIAIATICLISNLVGSAFVIICVFITLTNVCGIMYFWGLYIDTVSCTLFIVCIGLSVDFSVHVIHSYIHSHGTTREMKMINGLKAIAPAVLNGGFSTLLAVSLLMFSDVYVFVAFFRIFVLVELFGLYNALVFLPVLLTLIGPIKSQKKIQESTSHSNNELDVLDLN